MCVCVCVCECVCVPIINYIVRFVVCVSLFGIQESSIYHYMYSRIFGNNGITLYLPLLPGQLWPGMVVWYNYRDG